MARHPADLLSLVAGLITLAFGLVLLTGGLGDLPMRWAGPAAAIGIGFLVLVAARPNREPEHEDPAQSEDA